MGVFRLDRIAVDIATDDEQGGRADDGFRVIAALIVAPYMTVPF